MARHNKIHLGPACENRPQTEDALADVAITPGSFVTYNATNEFILATAALAVQGTELYVASENWFAGLQVDDDNPADQTMTAYKRNPKEILAALLITGQNITARDTALKLSDTAGQLEVATVGTDHVVAYAREVFNNNTGSAQLIAIRPATL
ncbi:hypothetical protein NVP1076O_26 [Vibrio phage 1.076.O._10N.286.51.B7]|nr:hypothetical protein NVP1076O_26 [Vibrio phage 1.076.O._10N.286.51.B7]